MITDDSHPKVKIQGNTIINHEGYAVYFDLDAHGLVSECLVLQDYCGFWNDPLLWVALKIIKRKYYKLFNDSLSETKIKKEVE